MFSRCESLCHCDASHQVLAQSDLRFERWPPYDFSNSESLCGSDVSHQVSAQSDLWFGGDVV